jgi:peptide deformylase
MVRAVLKLGDPRLREIAEPVADVSDEAFRTESSDLSDTLAAFRREHGFGRAIAAPQIGVSRRFIAYEIDDRPGIMVNPRVVWSSEDKRSLWDDCMSFPELLVRVRRSVSISVLFLDSAGEPQEWSQVVWAVSELLQHEIDHLNGVLAIDRAIDRDSIVFRSVYDEKREFFEDLVG